VINSKRKGKSGELQIANILKEHGYDCRRSQQFCGYAPDGQPDVVGLPGIHIEVKRVERLNIDTAMEQAIRDCQNDIPTVWHRRNRKPWYVTMRLEDWIDMYERTR
jgi:hypothetical protein